MTSGPGEAVMIQAVMIEGVSRRPVRRRTGFTIVEVLMVIAVMTILFTLVMVAASRLSSKAKVEATKAMIHRLRDKLDEYRNLKGSYPPDGLDFEVKNRDGRPIWGAACLYEFLSQPLTLEENVAGQIRTLKHDALMEFKSKEITDEDPENPGIHEVVDGFGVPFHYDNTENGVFAPDKQGASVHLEPLESHPLDPRDDPEVVARRGIQRPGAYDLWSHGHNKAHNEDEEVDLKMTIATWNVDTEGVGRASEAASSGKSGEK